MEKPDIYRNISYHINDIQDVISYCQLNQYTQHICSNETFWLPFYKKYALVPPITNYTNINDWIKHFNKSYYVEYKIEMIIKQLKNHIDYKIIPTEPFNIYEPILKKCDISMDQKYSNDEIKNALILNKSIVFESMNIHWSNGIYFLSFVHLKYKWFKQSIFIQTHESNIKCLLYHILNL